MIALTHMVSGPEVGRALAGDTEELGYALMAVAENADQSTIDACAEDLVAGTSGAQMVKLFCQRLANAINEQQEA